MRAILMRDLALSVRSGGGFGLALAFFLIVAVLVPFGTGPDRALLSRVAPGVIWVAALLACLLSLDRMFATDHEDGVLALLVTAPVPAEGIVLAKAVAHWVTTGIPLAVMAAVLGFLLGLPGQGYGVLVLSLLIGSPALSLIGAFGAALTVGLRRGGLLLSLLVLPLYVPTLIFGADAARRAAEGQGVATPLLLLAAVSFGALAVMPYAAGRVLRINLR